MLRQPTLSSRRSGAADICHEDGVMTALALPQSSMPWNWPRVGALSGALSLHLVVLLLLLIPPVALRVLDPPPPDITHVRVLDPPPKLEEPPLPTPPKVIPEVRQKPVRPAPPAAVAPPIVESPLPAQQADPTPPPRDQAPTAPVDVAPTALAYNVRTRIAYPRDAARMHQHGTVILSVLVGADGVPQSIEIEKSSGWRSLDNAARDAVRHWTFQPGTRNGIATALWARVPISFDLQTL
jgi:protein TonB